MKFSAARRCGSLQPIVDRFAETVRRNRRDGDRFCSACIEFAQRREQIGGGFHEIT